VRLPLAVEGAQCARAQIQAHVERHGARLPMGNIQ
jgi:hypothetical protein